ncbi:MAG: glycosyltransferase family 2 protein [Bacteroidetes bacterium]|nr:glycosyltransferase family 2 protein [Bacteroidota bacterium]MBS1929774.1 glycosyltransferase family 2 protein [Bacteroidota bacterium]
MKSLSVAIITLNEEKNISRCLDSVKNVADEILIVDSFSTDRTKELALQYGATFIEHEFEGFIEQKNWALQQTAHEYVLLLDADEALSPELIRSILKEKENNFSSDAYRMNRCTNYCGKFIRHGLWYPDKKTHLFKKQIGKWGSMNPHAKVILQRGTKVTYLPGDILHYSYNSIDEHVLLNNKYSLTSAAALLQRGKKTNWFKILVNPAWAFVNGYFFRLGFLDGFFGYVIAKNISHLTFLKHCKLYQMQKKK